MKHTILFILMRVPLTALRASDDAPIAGAIRWDAWCSLRKEKCA